MALAEFLKQIDLEEMAKGGGLTKKKEEPQTVLETGKSDSSAFTEGLEPTAPPQDKPTFSFINTTFAPLSVPASSITNPVVTSERRRSRRNLSQQSVEGPEGRNKRRANRSASASLSRQRLHGLIDELWELVPEEQKLRLEGGQLVSRTEKIEMAISLLKSLQEQQGGG